jgi:DHA1 family bicyclomycin/chloramphenicol resistance-like MFS transporter
VLFGIIALSLLALYLPETSRERRTTLGLGETFANYASLLADRRFVGPTLFFACVMASFFATQAAIPYFMVEILGRPASEYGIWFAVTCAFYVAGNYATGRWGDRVPRHWLILTSGIGCFVVAVTGFVAASVLQWSSALLFVPTILICFFGAIAIAPVQAEAVAAQPRCAGSASGLMSGIQMTMGALVVQLVGFSHNGTPYPMFVALIGCASIALLAIGMPYIRLRTRLALATAS